MYYSFVGTIVVTAHEFGKDQSASRRDVYLWRPLAYALGVLVFCLLLSWLAIGRAARLSVLVAIGVPLLTYWIKSHEIARRELLILTVLGAISAILCFVLINGMGYATVLTPENMIAGLTNGDTLYHTAIASMFSRFGIPSTGLDGLQVTHYHTLSHLILGLLSRGADQPTTTGYYLGMQLVFVPVLLFAVVEATADLARSRGTKSPGIFTVCLPLSFVFFVGLVDLNSFLDSESHTLGLLLLLLGLPYLRSLVVARDKIDSRALLVGLVLVLLVTAAKVSAGGIFAVGLGFALLRGRRLRIFGYVMIAVFGAVLTFLLRQYLLPIANAGQSKLNPLEFFKAFPVVSIANLAVVIVGGILCFTEMRGRKLPVFYFVALVMLVASAVPTLLLQLDGGSAYYFINVGTWIAIVLLSGSILGATFLARNRLLAVACSIAAPILMTGDIAVNGSQHRLGDSIRQLYQALAKNPGRTSIFGELDAIAQGAANAQLTRLAAGLRKYDDPRDPSLVLLSTDVWKKMPYTCQAAPFFVPAETGLPMLWGLRTTEQPCDFGVYYTFPDYDQTPPSPESQTAEEFCAAAIARGFHKVLFVRSIEAIDSVRCDMEVPAS